MSKNQKASGITNIINYDNSGNISFVSGSTTLMSVSSSGAVVLTGTMSGGVATSASLSANSNLLQGTGSIGFATTASLLAVSSSQQQISSSLLQVSASYIALSASYNVLSGSASTRVTQIENTYATTGSNSFRANQSITGSLVVSSTITAQTLVVQTVTSSIVYSSGSNIFGSQLSNTQTFTGSLNVTGSNHLITGSVVITPSLYVTNAISSGSFPFSVSAFTEAYNLGTNGYKSLYSPAGTAMTFSSQIYNFTGSSAFLIDILAYTSSAATNVYFGAVAGTTGNGPANFVIGRRTATSAWAESLRIDISGNIGIGTTNPSSKLTLRGTDSTSMFYLGISGSSANGEAVGITFGSATYDKARIVAYNENSGNAAGYLTLWTGGSPTTTDITERMRITSAGKVGIGITTPAEVLEVSGSLKIGNLKIQNVNGGSIGFNRNTADGAIYNPGYAAFQINGALSGTNYLDFQNYSSSGSYLGSFVFKDGNLGVGTTAPNTRLQILGPTLTVGDQTTYALGVGNSSGYDLTLATGTSYTYIQSWTSKPLNINSQGNNVVFSNGSTNVGIGTTNPFVVFDVRQPYAKTDTTRRDILYASNDSTPAGLRISITGGASQAVRTAHLQTTEWGVGNDGIISLQPFGGKVGIGVTNPSKLFEVNGRMATSATVSTNLIAGNIASNMPSSPAYIPIFNLAEAAGFSLVGYINAASYTCFNISQIYIRKEYSGSGINAGITGLYKNACDFSIVNITYSGVTYVALRFTSNPEIDVMWTGYLLNYAFNGDGSAQVWTSGVTLNSTYASY